MGVSRWLRRSFGVLVGLCPAAIMYLLNPSQFGTCTQAWYLSAAFLGAVPWFVVFMGGVSTLFETDASESRDFALGSVVGALVLAAVFVTGFATDTAPPGVPTTAYCHDGATLHR